jgi:DNA-binding response OmpR family regulator
MTGKRAGKLLLVEDEHLLRGLIAQFLRGEGFEVIEAADGSQGVNLFRCMRPFDVILLDLNLPEIPGVEVCRRIKSEQPSQPVIICSAAIIDAHLAKLRELNVQQFLTKPYHPRDLLDCIDAEIARTDASCPRARRLAPIAHGPIRRSASGHPVAPPTPTLFKTPILD